MQIYSGNNALPRKNRIMVSGSTTNFYANSMSDGDKVKIAQLNAGNIVSSSLRILASQNPTSLGWDELDVPIEETKKIQYSKSDYPIYAWYSNGKIKIWSEADVIKVNPNASQLFSNLPTVETIDLSWIDFTGVINLGSLFNGDAALTTVIGLENIDTS